jgi:ABC-2 type transport system ATP-binding protein
VFPQLLNPADRMSTSNARQPLVLARLAAVRKRFGSRWALNGIDLEVRSGEILVILGPNGAGKTTALSILTGLRPADSGTVQLLDGDPRDARVRRGLGVTPQDMDFPALLRVEEIVELVRIHFPKPLATDQVLARFELTELRSRYASALSFGERRRLAVAVAFAGHPRLVCLDEPTTGLDVESRQAVWRALREYTAGGGTVLFTTHYLAEADELATRVVIVDGGRTIFEGLADQIKAQVGKKRVRLHATDLPSLDTAEIIKHESGRYFLSTGNADAVVEELVRRNIAFSDLEIYSPTLEEAFLSLTERPR